MKRLSLQNIIGSFVDFIGLLLLALGVGAADSESILLPFLMALSGLAILYVRQKDIDDDEEDYDEEE